MNTIKKIVLTAIAFSAIGLQGCVTVTAESDPEESAFTDTTPVGFDHTLHEVVKVGELEGFSGTSIFPIMGKVSPDLDQEGAKEALETSLSSAGMLAPVPEKAGYQLNATMEKNSEYGGWAMESSWNGVDRSMTIRYELFNLEDWEVVYGQSIESYGKSDGGGLAFYLVEKEASEASYKDSFRQLITDLKSFRE